MFGSGFAHEGIHGFAWKLCKNRYSELRIKFGFSWKAGGFFTHFTGPMPIQPYIIGIAAPGVLLGLLPVMSGLVSGHISVTIFGAFNLAISGGDFAVLWVTRQVPKNRQVMDHSTRMGFLMLDVPSTPVVGPAVSSLQR